VFGGDIVNKPIDIFEAVNGEDETTGETVSLCVGISSVPNKEIQFCIYDCWADEIDERVAAKDIEYTAIRFTLSQAEEVKILLDYYINYLRSK
jgi:hypothetical protein